MTSVVWLRRDLRLHDHPALRAASDEAEHLVPVFCLDERLLRGRHASGVRTQFLLEALADLDGSLRDRGSRLVIRRGDPVTEIPALAREVGADRVHFTADAGPYARARDNRVARALAVQRTQACAHAGMFVVDEPAEVLTAAGGPYGVFTPFYRAWDRAPRREVHPAPSRLPPLPGDLAAGTLPRLSELGLGQEVYDPPRGGEHAGRARMSAFLDGAVADYAKRHDRLDLEGTSRLSSYLHLGCVSARELEHGLGGGRGAAAFRRQLCWRDFYAHVLRHHPANVRCEHQARYRDAIDWSSDRGAFDAWCRGVTGYPLVDAGMRQLRAEGWMHNRARLVVGSFLTKDLGIDWRWGERWFMRLLLDGDEANNNGNWQWVASVGADPQPPFRRMFSPTRQQARFDPSGTFVRRYVPELRSVPDRYLSEPWRMSDEIQRAAGCVIGRDYPEPIVDRVVARRQALARLGGVAGP